MAQKVHKKGNKHYLSAMQFVSWTRREGDSDFDAYQDGGAIRYRLVAEDLSALSDTVAACGECALQRTRRQTVFGAGSQLANWMFVGEAPGAEEDRCGIPFVGRAGELLEGMMAALNLTRGEAYITNVLKCRPPDNRDPLGVEVRSCEKYLHKQIELIQPKVIIGLGRFAAQSLLKSSLSIGKLRGRIHLYQPYDIPLVATYHPAYLLRSPLEKRKAWSDLLLANSVVS